MDSLKLPFKFDTVEIKKELAQFSREAYYDISNTSVEFDTLLCKHLIEPIGGPDKAPDFLPNEALKKCPYILSILETFQCKKETFRVHTLKPGASIRPHRDMGCSFENGKVRLHIPVETNPDVQLLLNNNPVKMEAGDCWYCNFDITHEIVNNSDEARVHLIMDCLVNDWVEELFSTASN
jgi:hypothetical protein